MKSYKIQQYPRESDPMGWVWDLRQALKDSTALCKILNRAIIQDSTRFSQDVRQNPIKSLLTLVKILGSLRQDFEQLNRTLSILTLES